MSARRAVLRALTFGLLAGSALAQGAKPAPLPPDIRRIVERGELVVAMPAQDTPPFFYAQDGEVRGVDADLARGIAEALKVKVRFHRGATSFNEVVDVVARGEADLAASKLSRTLARARAVRFSEPYLRLRHALALNRVRFAEMAKGREVNTVVRQFDGRIGVIAGTSFVDFAQRYFPAAEVVPFPAWNEAVAALKAGEVAALYRDEFEIKRLLKEDPRSALVLRTVTLTDTEDSLGVAVAADAHNLLGLVNLYLAQRNEKLDIGRLLKRLEKARD